MYRDEFALALVDLDAGAALNITGPAGARQVPKSPIQNAGTEYKVPGSVVGGGAPPILLTPEFLVPGSYMVDNGSGGADVKGFSATLTWSGSGLVAILGNSANPAAGVGAQFLCVAGDADNGTLTVPAWVLSALPASGLATDIPAPVGFPVRGYNAARHPFPGAGNRHRLFQLGRVPDKERKLPVAVSNQARAVAFESR